MKNKKSALILLSTTLVVIMILFSGCKKDPDDSTDQGKNTVTDVDGNVYKTVTIGTQVWMIENLKTTKYRNGDLIGTTNPATFDISDEADPKYQWAYWGDDNNAATFGRLYTWDVISDSRNICPTGWHVPSLEEFETLINFLGGVEVAANKLIDANGFKALMAGYRYYTDHFLQINSNALWWTSSEDDADFAYKIQIETGESSVLKSSFDKNYGLSVRCIKN